MKIGDSVIYCDEKGKETFAEIVSIDDIETASLSLQIGETIIKGIKKITARNIKNGTDTVIGPCYDSRPRKLAKQE